MSISANAQITLIDTTEAYTILLTNEAQQFPTNSSRVPLSNVSYYTDIIVYQGTTERTDYTIGTISSANNITVSQTSSRITFSVSTASALSADSGTFIIPITIDGQIFNKIFSWSCAKQGEIGNAGQNATSYRMIVSNAAIVKSQSGTYSPASITLTGKSQTGTSAMANYSGRFKIFLNGSSTASYTSSANESSKTYTIPANTTSIRCVMYQAGGTSVILDEQTIPVVIDGLGISSTAITYQVGSSGTTPPTGTWQTSVQTAGAGQYLWTRTITTYSDGSTTTSYSVSRSGSNGDDGRGISSCVTEYQASSSGTTIPTGTWSTTIPTVSQSQYLWTRNTFTYTDNTTNYSYSVGRMGSDGATGTGYTIVLSNESHTFPASTSAATASTASTNVIAYKNTSQVAATITKIGSTSVSGNASGVVTGITGLTASITNNGDTSCAITFSATTSLTTKSGTIVITMTVDGKTFTKNFSFSLALTGATGTAAKSVDITASSQVFKSTDGGTTFSPDTIKLTPVFQGGITYSKWQYSVNGGSSWTDVTSGSHGLTISSGVLTIAKTSDLYTDSITSVSFKCISSNSSYYDTITVLKLYDVTGLQDDLEDLQNQITTITDTISGVESKVNANTKSITDKVWQTDISTSINEYDGSTVKTIRDRVTSTEKDISGMKTTLSNVQTTVSEKADGSTVQTLSNKVATIESDYNGFKNTVSDTYTTKEEFNDLEIGGRNLISNIPSNWQEGYWSNSDGSYTGYGGRICTKTGINVNPGETYAIKIYINGITSKNLLFRTYDNDGGFIGSVTGIKNLIYTVPNNVYELKFVLYDNVTLDDLTTGAIKVKVEKGNKATDWTPAPEDVEQSITNVSSQYTQLADKFNWIVKSGTSSSDFTITDRLISLTSTALNIDALTTFKNSAENGTSTVINGGAIKTNTITATQIAANAITTDKLKANSVTTAKLATDAIKSTNYSYSSGNFSSAGTFLDLSTGLLRSKNFAIDSSGNAYFKGNVQANAGYIGGTSGWAITTNTITGNENSKIISGILESSNFVENSTGVQMNLNTGIIKGNIKASTLAAKDALQIYVGDVKRNVMTGYVGDGFFYTMLGCDLTIGDVSRVNPSIILNKSTSSTSVSDMITINTEALDIYANTTISGSLVANDLLTYGVINTSGNNVYCNDVQTRTGWAADRLSHGQTAYSNLMSGRISFKWAQNSSGVWKIYVYVDGTLVRSDW